MSNGYTRGVAKAILEELLEMLRDHPSGLNVNVLAERLNVKRQTIYKQQDKARAAHGIHLEIIAGHVKVANHDRVFEDLDQLSVLTKLEVHDLIAALARLEGISETAQRALEKLKRGRTKRILRDFEHRPVIHYEGLDRVQPDVFERLVEAILERQTIWLTYTPATGLPSTAQVDPYQILARQQHLVLLAANHAVRQEIPDAVIQYRLDAIEKVRQTRAHFPDPKFDVRAYLAGRFGARGESGEPVTVRVWFSSEKAGFVKRTQHHASQTTETLEDGGLIWTVQVPLSEDLADFVLKHGRHARILEPVALKDLVIEKARAVLEMNG